MLPKLLPVLIGTLDLLVFTNPEALAAVQKSQHRQSAGRGLIPLQSFKTGQQNPWTSY
jgi:hypothetical protein